MPSNSVVPSLPEQLRQESMRQRGDGKFGGDVMSKAADEIERLRSQEIPAAVRRGAHTVIPAKERELHRARAAEALLRHVERLLRNEPNYQRIREDIGKHLSTYRDYEQREPDVSSGYRIDVLLAAEDYTPAEAEGIMDKMFDFLHSTVCGRNHGEDGTQGRCSRDFMLSAKAEGDARWPEPEPCEP